MLLHFADKSGLLHAALHEDLEEAIARCLAATTRGRSWRASSAVARPFYAYYAVRPKLSRMLLRESLFADEPWRGAIRRAGRARDRSRRGAGRGGQGRTASSRRPRTPRSSSVAFCSFYYFALIGWVQGGIDDPLALFKKLMAQHLAAGPVKSEASTCRKRWIRDVGSVWKIARDRWWSRWSRPP